MKMYTERVENQSKKIYYYTGAVIVIIGIILVIVFSSKDNDGTSNNGTNVANGDTTVTDPEDPSRVDPPNSDPDNPDPVEKPPVDPPAVKAVGVEGMTQQLSSEIGPCPLTRPEIDLDTATDSYKRGIDLFKKKTPGSKDLLEARRLLNVAYTSEKLSDEQQEEAGKALENLAARTVLKPTVYINPDDPYTMSYKIVGGDLLGSTFHRTGELKGHIIKKGVIARHKLNVPPGIILRVNGLKSASQFRAEQNYKLVRGPFHLVVYLSARRADLFIQDLLVKRIKVCVGGPETPTPTGYFRVAAGGMTTNSSYNPPVDSNLPNKTIRPGQPGYPLGSRGLNIKIEGIYSLGTDIPVSRSYAIHGTNDPSSIGHAKSMGCIRLADPDMEYIYDCLQSYGEIGSPKISWTQWSTIWIRP